MLYLSGLVNIPKDLYEAAAIDGANVIQRIHYVTIPMLSGTTFFIIVTSIINSFKVFGLINLMTNGGPGSSTTMLVYNIYRTGLVWKTGICFCAGYRIADYYLYYHMASVPHTKAK